MLDLSAITDIQAEATVIATLFRHPDFILHSENLKAKYFYNVEHGCLYWAIQELYKAGVTTIDALNITNMINSNKAVKREIQSHNIGDIQKFIEMSQYAARHTLEEYRLNVNRVISLSFKRDLCKASGEIGSRCYDLDSSLSDINKMVNNRLNDLMDAYLVTDTIQLFGNKVDDLWEKIRQKKEDNRIPSKFQIFDEYFKYDPTELVLIKARMKAGKSAFLMNELINAVGNNVPTLYINTEMSDENTYKRLLANISGIKYSVIDNNRFSSSDLERIKAANEWIKQHPFVHEYLPGWNDDEIYTICKKLKYQIGLRFVIFDYLKSNEASSSENYNILGARADFLKNRIAGELNLAVVAGAQLSRENRVADSDKIDRYVSTSITWRFKTSEELKRDGLDCGNILAYVDLNRNGKQMDEDEAFSFIFDGDHMRIQVAPQPKRTEETPFEDEDSEN